MGWTLKLQSCSEFNRFAEISLKIDLVYPHQPIKAFYIFHLKTNQKQDFLAPFWQKPELFFSECERFASKRSWDAQNDGIFRKINLCCPPEHVGGILLHQNKKAWKLMKMAYESLLSLLSKFESFYATLHSTKILQLLTFDLINWILYLKLENTTFT